MFKVAIILETKLTASKGQIMEVHTVEVHEFKTREELNAFMQTRKGGFGYFTLTQDDPDYNLI